MDTTTTMFLVPGLGIDIEEVKFRYGFINAYLQDKEREPYERGVYLLFKPKSMIEFQLFFEREKTRTHQLIEDYDYDGGYIVLVYVFPDEYLLEYKLFLRGKYSKFRSKYRQLLPDIDSKIDSEGVPFTEYSMQFMIIYKAPALKKYMEKKLGTEFEEEDELWSKPDIKKETLDISKIISYGRTNEGTVGTQV
jgi:hypothetical protein